MKYGVYLKHFPQPLLAIFPTAETAYNYREYLISSNIYSRSEMIVDDYEPNPLTDECPFDCDYCREV